MFRMGASRVLKKAFISRGCNCQQRFHTVKMSENTEKTESKTAIRIL